MSKVFLGNAFSLSMISEFPANIVVSEVSLKDLKEVLQTSNWESVVGHQSTAEVMTELTGISIPVNRVQVKLEKNDTLIVFQLLKRLEEGKVLSAEELKALPFKILKVELV